jgi:hypothetical protein
MLFGLTTQNIPERVRGRLWENAEGCRSYGGVRLTKSSPLGVAEFATYGSIQLGIGDDSSLKLMSDPPTGLRISCWMVT